MNSRSILFLVIVAGMLLVGTASAIPPPVANFEANETNICLGDTIAFTDLSENYPESWLWSFGDGNTSTEQNVSFTYGYAGVFTVSLNVTNPAGFDFHEEKAYITVTDCAGNPNFYANVTCQIGTPTPVLFTGSCPDPETKNHWDFGDGNTTDDIQSPEYTYYSYGIYTVSHTCDAAGYDPVIETKTDYITIGVNGTVCAADCGCAGSTSGGSGDDELPNYLIIGATIGILIGGIMYKRKGEQK